MVLNMIFLGVPNSISEELVKETIDTVLQGLEADLLKNDKDYKVPIGQKGKWIQYASTKEYPGGMPWEDQEDTKKKKQTSNSSRLAFVFHVHRPEARGIAACNSTQSSQAPKSLARPLGRCSIHSAATGLYYTRGS